MKIFLLLIFILSTNILFADCSKLEREILTATSASSQKINIALMDEQTPRSAENHFKKLISELNAWLSQEFRLPSELRVEVHFMMFGAGARPGRVRSPYQIAQWIEHKKHGVKYKKLVSKHPSWSDVFFSHEYGHAVFYANAAVSSQPWGNVMTTAFESFFQINKELLALVRKGRQIRLRQEKSKPEKAKRLEELLRKLREEDQKATAELKASMTRLYKIKEVVIPYEEFFADLVAVIHFNNPRAIRDSLRNLQKDNSAESTLGRDFSERFPLWKWESEKSEHLFFSPLRSFLWKYYFSNPVYNGRHPWLLRQIFEVFEQDIQNRFMYNDFKNLTPRVHNERLMKAISQKIDNHP